MFALDLFNTDHERRLAEGAVDRLEQRRIDDLAMKMDDLVARAKDPAYKKNPAALAGLMKEFQKCKEERDSYYKIREAGIPGNVPAEKIPGKEDLLKGKGRSYYESQKKNSEQVTEDQRLHVGDPIIVTAPNEFEGKTGEVAEFSPSGKFVVVNLYNHGEHNMHLSDIEYNQYADDQEEDDWYDEEEMAEGWSNKMVAQRTGQAPTAYSVYIKGKEWKSFPDDDHAEAVANKLRAKFKAEGRDPSVITIAPTDYDKGIKEAIVASGPSQPLDDRAVRKLVWDTMKINADSGDQAIQRALAVLAKKPQSRMVQDLQDKFQNLADRLAQGVAEAKPITSATDTTASAKKLWQYIGRNLEDLASNADFDAERNELYINDRLNNLFKTADGQPVKVAFDMGSGIALDKGILYIPIGTIWQYRGMYTSEKFINDVVKALSGQTVSEASTDYSKRRARERDVDAGKPVAKQRQSKMTDYQKRRAQDKKDMALGEGKIDYNFDAEDLKRLERIRDLPTLKAQAFALISKPSAKPMKPEKVEWFKQTLEKMNSPLKVIKLMYDLLLSGEGHAVVGSKSSMNPNSYRQRFGEQDNNDNDSSGVERAILNRIMVAHTDLLMKFGPEKVMQAAEEVAYNVGDVDEIGTSDVSAYVAQVKQILGVPEELDEKWSQKYKSSINCANPKGFSQKAHCASKKK